MFGQKKTFRPKKNFKEGTVRYNLYKNTTAALTSGVDLRECVRLPDGEDINEWMAMHTVDFFNRINLIYGTVCDFCTEECCPKMTGGEKYEYRWCDKKEYKKPTMLSAPRYIDLLMRWIEDHINDEQLFPPEPEVPFPKTFMPIVKKIFSRLYRVFVHVYYHHFERLVEIGAEAHINTCYKHFYLFISEFQLINPNELAPLQDLTDTLCS